MARRSPLSRQFAEDPVLMKQDRRTSRLLCKLLKRTGATALTLSWSGATALVSLDDEGELKVRKLG